MLLLSCWTLDWSLNLSRPLLCLILNVLLSDTTVLGPNASAWCKSAIGVLHFLARGTRWDISLAVSMISQFNANPTRGTEAAIRYLAGYLNATVGSVFDRCAVYGV